ncbi:MAG: M1 family metallopeptidase [Bacteroidales bacterium]|nr:M1 family metallopeptidase [Bacteroidales bacterium]
MAKFFVLFTFLICYVYIYSKRYFNQYLHYTINVYLNEKAKTLNGKVKIIYKNNSDDTLSFIYFHAYPNSSKYKRTSLLAKQKIFSNDYKLYFLNDSLVGYMDSLNFYVNNIKSYFYFIPDTPDIVKLLLPQPLLPYEKITIETSFFVKLPYKKIMRMGYDTAIFAITQWYPKAAVYDSAGWHPIPYLDNGEYYGEFALFDVFINVPDNYIVAATGLLCSDFEIDRLIHISNSSNSKDVFNSNARKTLHFKIDSVHDFAWFASPYFKVEIDSILLQNKIVYTYAYYISNYRKGLFSEYIKDALFYYSNIFGVYPYKVCSVVETPDFIDGGMEYPTITNIGKFENNLTLYKVILHEIGHNWLYGALASNEREQPFIDEGLNTFIEEIYSKLSREHIETFEKASSVFKINFAKTYMHRDISNYFYYINLDKPLICPPHKFGTMQYFVHNYYKGAYSWNMLCNYVGKHNFISYMNNFYSIYKFKHINHNSFKDVFISENDSIKWFFNDLLFTTNRSEYKFKKVKYNNNKIKGLIINTQPTYFPCAIYVNDTLRKIISPTNPKNFFEIDSVYKVRSICINQNYDFLEKNYNNNFKIFGVKNKLKHINIDFAGYKNNIGYYDIYLLPILLYNTASSKLLGLAIYTPFYPNPYKNIRIMPLFSYSLKKIEGSFYLSHPIENIILETYIQTYSISKNNRWYSYNFSIKFNKQVLEMLKDNFYTVFYNFNYSSLPFNSKKFADYSTLGINASWNKGIFKIDIFPRFQISTTANFAKFLLNTSASYIYNEKKKKIGLDYFVGTFLLNNSNMFYYNIFLSGRYGFIDYQYSDYYFDRKYHYSRHNFFSHQCDITEGLFTTFSPIQTNKWLTSVRLWLNFPITLPLTFYFATATYYKAGILITDSYTFPYEYGFELRFIKDIFAIYFPIGMSADLQKLSNNYCKNYFEKVRFTLKVRELNFFRYIDKGYKLSNLII